MASRKLSNTIKRVRAEQQPIKDKLKGLKDKAGKFRQKLNDSAKKDAEKAYKKPSVTDKRSRDFFGKLTKESRKQDPNTGGPKKPKRRKPKK